MLFITIKRQRIIFLFLIQIMNFSSNSINQASQHFKYFKSCLKKFFLEKKIFRRKENKKSNNKTGEFKGKKSLKLKRERNEAGTHTQTNINK